MPARALSILCLLQFVALVGSWFVTRSFARFHEIDLADAYPDSVWFDWMRFGKWAVWLLIFIPAVLVYVGTKLSVTHRGTTMIQPWWFWISAAITGGVLCYTVLMPLVALRGPPRRVRILNLN